MACMIWCFEDVGNKWSVKLTPPCVTYSHFRDVVLASKRRFPVENLFLWLIGDVNMSHGLSFVEGMSVRKFANPLPNEGGFFEKYPLDRSSSLRVLTTFRVRTGRVQRNQVHNINVQCLETLNPDFQPILLLSKFYSIATWHPFTFSTKI